ncbi:MAG: 2'-5' RNA ligase family protein, partial [Asgard group archaeon]|nr:2'-5' RNA ligase family protein [Asgard group archaeon]
GISVTPFPHFSWQVAEDYKWDRLENELDKLAYEIPPFKISTAGLGIFTGESPVLFIGVVKTEQLIAIHKKITTQLSSLAIKPLQYYFPEHWVPHISLAYGDLKKNNIGKVIEWLAFEPLYMEINIDNIAFIFEPTGEVGKLMYNIKLKG